MLRQAVPGHTVQGQGSPRPRPMSAPGPGFARHCQGRLLTQCMEGVLRCRALSKPAGVTYLTLSGRTEHLRLTSKICHLWPVVLAPWLKR